MKLVTTTALVLVLGTAAAQSPAPPAERKEAALERLIHKAVVKELPKVHEDTSGWGRTIPIPERLPLPRLKRTVVKVGDRTELPDGPWRKVRLWLDDPDRDLRVRVRDFTSPGANTYRLTVETDATVSGETDVQQWRNGLLLVNLTARADARLQVVARLDVTTRLDTTKLPPALAPQVKIPDLTLTLNSFDPKQVTFLRAGLTVRTEGVGEEFRGALQSLLRAAEPKVKERAEAALARSLKDGKGPLTPLALLKAVAPLLAEKDGAPKE